MNRRTQTRELNHVENDQNCFSILSTREKVLTSNEIEFLASFASELLDYVPQYAAQRSNLLTSLNDFKRRLIIAAEKID